MTSFLLSATKLFFVVAGDGRLLEGVNFVENLTPSLDGKENRFQAQSGG